MPRRESKMFGDELNLKDAIIQDLREDPKSISKLTRDLESKGMKFHKLVITGYLRALADLGYVEEREFAPSKVYSISTPLKRDIYELVGKKTKNFESRESKQIILAIYTLQRIFRRAIFFQEVKRCGFTEGVEAEHVDEATRAEARKIVINSGLKLPKNDPAYLVQEDLLEQSDRILLELLIDDLGIKKLVRTGKQTTLGEDM